jgi:hypothetical protein
MCAGIRKVGPYSRFVRKDLILQCDYGIEWPLWLEHRGRPRGPVDAHHLRLSESTMARMRAWFNAYLGNEGPDGPLWTAPEGTSENDEEEAWVAEGAAIRDLIQTDVGRAYRVEYRT